jgi:hypothetical protein
MRRLPTGETLGVSVIRPVVPCGGCFAAGGKDDFFRGLLDLASTGVCDRPQRPGERNEAIGGRDDRGFDHRRARVAKLADALDLGSSAARRAGSTPASRIITGNNAVR